MPAGVGARQYMSPVSSGEDAAPGDRLREAFLTEIARAAQVAGLRAPAHDVRLDKAADDIAHSARHVEVPSFEVMNFFLSHYGIAEPEPASLFERGSAGAETLVLEDLQRQLPDILKSGAWGRVGVGVDRGTADFIVLLMLQERSVDLEPVPRGLPSMAGARVRGALHGQLEGAQIFVTAPTGKVRELTVGRDRARFETQFWCSDGDGRYQLEILGTDDKGPKVVANFPIFCGVPIPDRAPTAAPEAAEDRPATDPAAIEQTLLGLVNRERTAAGLRALTWDRDLAVVARGHSRDMVQHDFVGHVSPQNGGLGDRLQRVGIAPALALENVGMAFSAGDVHRGLMSSPGHRGNIIDPRATHIGIGVAIGKAQDGRRPLFVTQVFAGGS